MQQVLLFILLGLGSGALIACIALAVVLTYRGAGIINLASGAMAMLSGYAFWSLTSGQYGGVEFATAPALVLTLVITLLIGVLIHVVAFRPLRNAAPLATVVAGTLGVLAASVTQLDAISLPLLVVPALAAALLARLTSFAIACAAGLGIGIINSLVDYASTKSWFPTDHGVPLPGVKELIAFLLIVVAMFLRGAALPARGELVERRVPAAPPPQRLAVPAIGLSLLCAVALVVLPFDFRQALINSLIGTIMALSLVVVTGFVGQISVVQLSLAGVAGFTVSHMAVDAGIGFPLAPLAGPPAGGVVGGVAPG